MTPKKAFQNLPPERQQEIIQTGIRLYGTHAFEEVTVRMICKELAINANTFYRYFDTRDDLYVYVYHQLSQRALAEADRYWTLESYLLPQEEEDAMYTAEEQQFLNRWLDLPEAVIQRLVFSPELNMVDLTRENIRREKEAGHMRADVNEAFTAYAFSTASYLIWRYAKDYHIRDEAEISRLREYFCYTLLKYGMRGKPMEP